MSANMISRVAAAAVTAFVLTASPVSAEPSEVSAFKVTSEAPTTIKLNVTGLQRRAVRQMVRVAAVKVCTNAVRNRELSRDYGQWCVGATVGRTMGKYDSYHDTMGSQLASVPEGLILSVS